ncbi:MAG: hypothetical protein KF718_16870 [Polyangiaceae bacterium]|nr:hypothetical protein [Polyangiaceae bacterium]
MISGGRVVEWSLAERARWPGGKPSAARIAEYFAPCVRNGKPLGLTAGNWCAAGACFAAASMVGTTKLESAGVPHAYRGAGLELQTDAQKLGAWDAAPKPIVSLGDTVGPGDLAIFERGAEDWMRHVGRVIRTTPTGFESIDANGSGAAWAVTTYPWNHPRLLGFIRWPRSSSLSGLELLAIGWGLYELATG